MKEPEVRALPLPKAEPILKVGLILPEDKKSEITIQSKKPLMVAGHTTNGGSYKISIKGSNFEISSDAGSNNILPSPLRLSCQEHIAPQSGIRVDGIIAGRGFHWEKQLPQSFAGELELHIIDQQLVLVNHIALESYIASVITSEMSSECPVEFAKAQAVAARSWVSVFLGHKHLGLPFTICNDDDCQRYQGTTHLTELAIKSVNDCRGEFLIDKSGHLCAAYYSKSCGGFSESARDIFGFDAPGCTAIKDGADGPIFCSPDVVEEKALGRYLGAVDQNGRYYRWSYQLNPQTIVKNVLERFNLDCSKFTEIKPLQRGRSGRILNAELHYLDCNAQPKLLKLTNQYDIRRVLHESFLLSSAFEIEKVGDKVMLNGKGWGHGVGLCQIGAVGMGLQGYDYKAILKHYYRDADLVKGY